MRIDGQIMVIIHKCAWASFLRVLMY